LRPGFGVLPNLDSEVRQFSGIESVSKRLGENARELFASGVLAVELGELVQYRVAVAIDETRELSFHPHDIDEEAVLVERVTLEDDLDPIVVGVQFTLWAEITTDEEVFRGELAVDTECVRRHVGLSIGQQYLEATFRMLVEERVRLRRSLDRKTVRDELFDRGVRERRGGDLHAALLRPPRP